jgi:hypothetical protein
MTLKSKKSVLLKTSSAADVVRANGRLKITGLPEIREKDILSIRKKTYAAEVVQVVTIGSYTPTAETVYKIEIGDVFGKREGAKKGTKPYGFTTPKVLTTIGSTAALQREHINGKIVAMINADQSANVVAASLGTGNGFTITDKPGYYPPRPRSGSRAGASVVLTITDRDGTGFVKSNLTVTTAAVYSFGVGAELLANAPVFNPGFGSHLISGEIDTPKTVNGEFAVAGQRYNAVFIEATVPTTNPTTVSQAGAQPIELVVFVDNGAGTITTNAAGYAAFIAEVDDVIADNDL